jgi:hypothetical protein
MKYPATLQSGERVTLVAITTGIESITCRDTGQLSFLTTTQYHFIDSEGRLFETDAPGDFKKVYTHVGG